VVLAICLMIAGVALIFGAKGFAEKLAKGLTGVVLILAGLPCLLRSCSCLLPGIVPRLPSASGNFLLLAVTAVLVVIGLIAWRRRAERAKARELWLRRNGAARGRALPAPPAERDGVEP